MRLVCFIIFIVIARQFTTTSTVVPEPLVSAAVPPNDLIPLKPVHGGNYRSAQPTLVGMDSILYKHRGKAIKVIVRLNGDGKDSGDVSVEQEAQICKWHGVQFYQFNAHAKDTPEQVAALMRTGGVWIHCLHGFDRTGAMVAYWMLLNGYTREQVIDHNGWKNYGEKGEAYQRQYYKFVNQ